MSSKNKLLYFKCLYSIYVNRKHKNNSFLDHYVFKMFKSTHDQLHKNYNIMLHHSKCKQINILQTVLEKKRNICYYFAYRL